MNHLPEPVYNRKQPSGVIVRWAVSYTLNCWLIAINGPVLNPMTSWKNTSDWWTWAVPFLGWGLLSHFLRSVIFPFFPNVQNSGYMYIRFIFGRYHRTWAAETPGKYDHDWYNLTYTLAKSEFPVTEKLANGASVTPIPEQHPIDEYRKHSVFIQLQGSKL